MKGKETRPFCKKRSEIAGVPEIMNMNDIWVEFSYGEKNSWKERGELSEFKPRGESLDVNAFNGFLFLADSSLP